MILAVFILSNYFIDDRNDELFLIPMFQDISKFYINMGFKPFLRRKRLTGKVVREIWKSGEYNYNIQNYTVILEGDRDSVELKNILNHCNGDLDILREGLTMIMDRATRPIASTGFSVSSGYLVKI